MGAYGGHVQQYQDQATHFAETSATPAIPTVLYQFPGKTAPLEGPVALSSLLSYPRPEAIDFKDHVLHHLKTALIYYLRQQKAGDLILGGITALACQLEANIHFDTLQQLKQTDRRLNDILMKSALELHCLSRQTDFNLLAGYLAAIFGDFCNYNEVVITTKPVAAIFNAEQESPSYETVNIEITYRGYFIFDITLYGASNALMNKEYDAAATAAAPCRPLIECSLETTESSPKHPIQIMTIVEIAEDLLHRLCKTYNIPHLKKIYGDVLDCLLMINSQITDRPIMSQQYMQELGNLRLSPQ